MKYTDDIIASASGIMLSIVSQSISAAVELSVKTFFLGAVGGAGGYLTKKFIEILIRKFKHRNG